MLVRIQHCPQFMKLTNIIPHFEHHWQFPLGSNTAMITISGKSPLMPEDVDALIEMAQMFKLSIVRANQHSTEDFSI